MAFARSFALAAPLAAAGAAGFTLGDVDASVVRAAELRAELRPLTG